MKGPKTYCVLILLVALVALALRLPHLAHRPMHSDEAVNAVKFGQLLEERFYRYDPHEYHGPTLNYFTLIPTWLHLLPKSCRKSASLPCELSLFFSESFWS